MSALSAIFLLLFLLRSLFKGCDEFFNAVGLIAETAVSQELCDRWMLHASDSGNGIPEAIGNLSRRFSF
jgi:hypothetical protein